MRQLDNIKNAVALEGLSGPQWREGVFKRLPIIDGIRAVGLTDGLQPVDGGEAAGQTLRQLSFPIELLVMGMSARIENAEASVEADRVRILNHIADRPVYAAVLPQCAAYDKINTTFHAIFVAEGWRLLLEAGRDMHAPCAILAASGMKRMALNLRGCVAFTDALAALLAQSLPTTLEEVRLECGQPDSPDIAMTITGGRALLEGVFSRVALSSLRILEMSDCMLSGALPDAIGECTALEQITIGGNQLSGVIPEGLGRCARVPCRTHTTLLPEPLAFL